MLYPLSYEGWSAGGAVGHGSGPVQAVGSCQRSEGNLEKSRSVVTHSLPDSTARAAMPSGARRGRWAMSHTCYGRRMQEVASRALRNQTRSLLDRVEAGERLTITVDGRAVAVLGPVSRRAGWMPRHEFTERVLKHQADPGLSADLDDIAGELTDEMPLS